MDQVSTLRIDHRSEQGAWTLLRRPPPLALRGHVIELQGYVEEGGRPVARLEPPTGVIPLILSFGPGFSLREVGSDVNRSLDRSFVAGLWDRPALVGSAGRAFCMQVDLTIAGARRYLGLDLIELAGRVVDLNQILGRGADLLEERLATAPDWETRFDLLEAHLLSRIAAGGGVDRRIGAALVTLDRSAGAVPVDALARELGLSRKHLATLFRRETGLTPKALGRILRFKRALARLGAGDVGSLAALAAECGYADQAHFNRDFRAFAGESPGALARRILPDGTGIVAEAW